MFDTFREKIQLTKELSRKGMVFAGEGFVIVDYWEESDLKGKKVKVENFYRDRKGEKNGQGFKKKSFQ